MTNGEPADVAPPPEPLSRASAVTWLLVGYCGMSSLVAAGWLFLLGLIFLPGGATAKESLQVLVYLPQVGAAGSASAFGFVAAAVAVGGSRRPGSRRAAVLGGAAAGVAAWGATLMSVSVFGWTMLMPGFSELAVFVGAGALSALLVYPRFPWPGRRRSGTDL